MYACFERSCTSQQASMVSMLIGENRFYRSSVVINSRCSVSRRWSSINRSLVGLVVIPRIGATFPRFTRDLIYNRWRKWDLTRSKVNDTDRLPCIINHRAPNRVADVREECQLSSLTQLLFPPISRAISM